MSPRPMDDKFILEEARSTNKTLEGTVYKTFDSSTWQPFYSILFIGNWSFTLLFCSFSLYSLSYLLSSSLPLQIEQSPLSFIFEETAYDSAKGLFASIVRQKQDEHM